MACVAVGARKRRRYGLYVSETQDQADDHVSNVAGMLESAEVTALYPDMADRLLSKYGTSKGWRRNRLRTASGFTLDAIGLDSAARGKKVDEDRPDFMVLDDLDGELDTIATTERKLTTLTRKLLPAGSADLAVLAIQNLVLRGGIFGRMVYGGQEGIPRADYLSDRILSGPHPAIRNLIAEQRDGRYVLLSGEPTWAGQDLRRCQEMVETEGYTTFLAECQHEVDAPPGGMFDHLEYRRCTWADVPDLLRIVVWVDPAVTDTDSSDSHGIQADGIAADGTVYRLWSWEARTTPQDAMKRAIRKARELKAECVGVETDQGGDTWRSVFREALEAVQAEGLRVNHEPVFREAKAGAGHGPKAHRGQQMLAEYERGRFVHVVGTHEVLERALKRFPRTKPYDLVDVCLVAGTMVTTAAGQTPIQDVRTGMKVLTRRGWKRVNWAGLTHCAAPTISLATENGRELRGTPNHPVWVEGAGWMPLSGVGVGDIMLICPDEKLLSSPFAARQPLGSPSIVPGAVAIGPSRSIPGTSPITPAWSAEASFKPPSIGGDGFVRERVVAVRPEAPADVFNLEVEAAPEYFANGILVHNCYWTMRDLLDGFGSGWDYLPKVEVAPFMRRAV